MSKNSSAGWPRPIDSTLHGATDYNVAALLTTVLPRLAGIEGTPAARQVRIAGAIHGGYSVLTKYPLGIVKLIPYRAHLAMDAAGAIALAATPFVTGQFTKGWSQWLPHVLLSVFEMASLALSDPTGRGDYKADVEAIRRANTEDPRRKIHEHGLAVKPAAAQANGSASATAVT